jgi:hypothetical protein
MCLALLPGAAASGEDGGRRPEARAAATEWLRSFVKTLNRPVEVYHYAYRPAIGLPAQGPVPDEARYVPEYLRRKSRRYWDSKSATRPYMMAGGLYAAIDPVITRTFGGIGESWALFQLTLPAGFRFVDVRGWSDNEGKVQRFPPAVRQQLVQAGCAVEFPSELLVAQESPECRALAVETMQALDADGLMYRYQGFAFEGCQGRPVGAFILTRPERVGRAQLLTSESPGPAAATEAHRRVRQLYLEARGLGSVYPAPWPDLAGLAAPERMVPWKQERLFGCGGHQEDRMPGPVAGQGAHPVDGGGP